jgi:hypothetical protein
MRSLNQILTCSLISGRDTPKADFDPSVRQLTDSRSQSLCATSEPLNQIALMSHPHSQALPILNQLTGSTRRNFEQNDPTSSTKRNLIPLLRALHVLKNTKAFFVNSLSVTELRLAAPLACINQKNKI